MGRLLAHSALLVALVSAALGIALLSPALAPTDGVVQAWGLNGSMVAALGVALALGSLVAYIVLAVILANLTGSQSSR